MIVYGILSKLLWITTAIGFVLYLLNMFDISSTIVLNLFIGSCLSTLIAILMLKQKKYLKKMLLYLLFLC